MKKQLEIDRKNSCWNKASNRELMFIILERDLAAPATIRYWCLERVRLGRNLLLDEQIKEALKLADEIEKYQNAKR